MLGTWPRPSSAISRSSHPSICPSIDPSSTPSFTSSRPLPPTRSTRSSPSSTCSPAISSKQQPENPLSGLQGLGSDRALQQILLDSFLLSTPSPSLRRSRTGHGDRRFPTGSRGYH